MKDPRNLFILVLLAVAAFLAGHALSRNEAHGQGYPGGTTDSNGQMIAVTGTIGSGVSVLWLIDTENGNLAVYQCRGGKSIELVAARKIEWDLKIETFHDESLLSPGRLRKMFFEQEQAGGTGGVRPEESGPKKGSGSSESEEK